MKNHYETSRYFVLIKACRLKRSIKKALFYFAKNEFIQEREREIFPRLLYMKQRSLMARIALFSDQNYFLLTRLFSPINLF